MIGLGDVRTLVVVKIMTMSTWDCAERFLWCREAGARSRLWSWRVLSSEELPRKESPSGDVAEVQGKSRVPRITSHYSFKKWWRGMVNVIYRFAARKLCPCVEYVGITGIDKECSLNKVLQVILRVLFGQESSTWELWHIFNYYSVCVCVFAVQLFFIILVSFF